MHNELYHIGIIDYLQRWDMTKKQERFFKTKFLNKNKDQLSAIEPVEYQKRWYEFMSHLMDSGDNDLQDAQILKWLLDCPDVLDEMPGGTPGGPDEYWPPQ